MKSGDVNTWPVGLALLDGSGKVEEINTVGREILGDGGTEVLEGLIPAPSKLSDEADGSGSNWSSGWIRASGVSRELAYRVQPSNGRYAIAFHDVTVRRQRERRATAVARTAARVASERSLPATLNALAHEILQADGLAGVQVLANEYSGGERLHMLGMAGFPSSRSGAFFSLLMECKNRGADLRMLDAFESGKPVIIPHRYAAIMSNPAWQPLHEFHRYPEWDAFASVPINVRHSTIGILNVFVKPGREIDAEAVDFLASMADQAGLAIDYASLLEEERTAAHLEERQRLARDLHDSVVQQVFSMGMLTQTLTVLAGAEGLGYDPRVQSIANELGNISGSVLKDLRGLVSKLRPSAIEGVGLGGALSRLAATTHRQTGVKFELHVDRQLDRINEDLGEDIYHVAAEAVHNVLKHSPADLVDVRCVLAAGRVLLTVQDNGGPPAHRLADPAGDVQEGHGLAFMRQRTMRWQGSFTVDWNFGNVGTVVRADVPFVLDDRIQGEK